MRMKFLSKSGIIAAFLWTIGLAFCGFSLVSGCTSIAIPASSISDGAALTMHTNDCLDCDSRLALVPGRDHPEGAMHPVYGIAAIYPRRTDGDRAAIYRNVTKKAPLAWIPEVRRTYGVWESSYALMNEKGLTFGESSCSSKIPAAGVDMADSEGNLGRAYFSISALMQLGLERCDIAVCAIQTMGSLAEKYGFYGESYMGGESLTIADLTGQAWVFHIMQTWSSNTSAIWVAQRVPTGHVAALGNEFTIQEVPIDGEQVHTGFMWSENIKSEAMLAGFWDGKGVFNFQKVYGTETVLGKNHYATMRLHWVYSHIAPSLNLQLKEAPADYSFSYPVDNKLSIEDAIDLFRGNYEGTEWDLTKGILAGPFGNPKRIEGGDGLKQVQGELPRPISIPRTSHVHIGVAHPDYPATLFGPDESGTTVFAPFFSSTLALSKNLSLNETLSLYSRFYQVGRRDEFKYRESAWWAFNLVSNALNFNYHNMSEEVVRPSLRHHQAKMLKVLRTGNQSMSVQVQNDLVKDWWDLYETLVIRYNDGTYNYAPGYSPKSPVVQFGYPASFLKEIGFNNDFWKSQSISNICQNKATFPDSIKPIAVNVLSALFGATLTFLFLRRKKQPRNDASAKPLLDDF